MRNSRHHFDDKTGQRKVFAEYCRNFRYIRRLNISAGSVDVQSSATRFQQLNGIVFVPDRSSMYIFLKLNYVFDLPCLSV